MTNSTPNDAANREGTIRYRFLAWMARFLGLVEEPQTPHDTEAPGEACEARSGHASVREGSNPPGRVAGLARTATHNQRTTPFPYGADSQEEADNIDRLVKRHGLVVPRPGAVTRGTVDVLALPIEEEDVD